MSSWLPSRWNTRQPRCPSFTTATCVMPLSTRRALAWSSRSALGMSCSSCSSTSYSSRLPITMSARVQASRSVTADSAALRQP